MQVNTLQKKTFVDKIKAYYGNDLKGRKFALWGLAFKPNTDDIREAPALYIIEELLKEGASVSAYDPEAMKNVKAVFGEKVEFTENQYDCLQDADALLIATEWNEFRMPDFDKISSLLKEKVIFDGRNLFDVALLEKMGFYYQSIGRSVAISKQ